MKFKVGDRVKVTAAGPWCHGHHGTVVAVDSNPEVFFTNQVCIDGQSKDLGTYENWFKDSELERLD